MVMIESTMKLFPHNWYFGDVRWFVFRLCVVNGHVPCVVHKATPLHTLYFVAINYR